MADMTRRMKRIRSAVTHLIAVEDALGLRINPSPVSRLIGNERWTFQTDSQKVKSFRDWLKFQTEAELLTPIDGNVARPWMAEYIDSAYRQAHVRSFAELGGEDAEAFLLEAFAAPETTSKLEFLYTRTFTHLEGITQDIGKKLSDVLVDGLAAGQNPRQIAREMTKQIDSINKARALTIARTEIIHAHAEGQLDSFERLGATELAVMAEWSTAGDDRVCPQCLPLEGVVMTIKEARGILPRHPNCRCAWIPANVAEDRRGQTRSASGIKDAIDESVLGERVSRRPIKTAREASPWLGVSKRIAKKRPKRIVRNN